MSSKHSRSTTPALSLQSQAGFTLIEMAVALVILLVGLLGFAAVLGYALTVSNAGRNVTNTKLLVVSVLEQMENLRNTRQLTFGQINNTGQVDNTGAGQVFVGFPTDFQPVSANPGPDGIFGTGDDITDAGSDGLYGTPDDYSNPMLARPGFARQILITTLSPDLKRVEVNLRYADGNNFRTMSAVSYLNNDARGNFKP